jgi:hypothetical protein
VGSEQAQFHGLGMLTRFPQNEGRVNARRCTQPFKERVGALLASSCLIRNGTAFWWTVPAWAYGRAAIKSRTARADSKQFSWI